MPEDQFEPAAPSRRSRKDAGLPAIGVLGGTAMAEWLRVAGIEIADVEPAPKQLSAALAARFHYGFASARAGALGDPRQILQLLRMAAGGAMPRNWVWTAPDGTLIDGLRPDIDPTGLASLAALSSYRSAHLAQVARLLSGIKTLILPLRTATTLIDAADGTAYPAPPQGVTPPAGCDLTETVYPAETMAADLAALRADVAAHWPGLTLWLLVPEPAHADLTERLAIAALRAVAADAAAGQIGLRHDPILDHLLSRPATDVRIAPLVQRLLAGGDLLDASPAAAVDPPAGDTQVPPRDRAARRAARAKRKVKAPSEAKVMCEDELLEAFS